MRDPAAPSGDLCGPTAVLLQRAPPFTPLLTRIGPARGGRKDGVLRPRPSREGIRVVASDAAVEGNRAEAGAAVAERHRAGDGDTVWSERKVAAQGSGTPLAARCSAAGFHPDPMRSSGRRRART